jgi:hypothetical protein
LAKGKIELLDDQEAKNLGLRQPSQELINIIKELGKLGTKISNVVEKLKERARSEGFNEDETKTLMRIYLKGVLSKRQIQYWVSDRDKMNLKRQLELKQQQGQGQGQNNQVHLRTKANVQDAQLVSETKTIELEQKREPEEGEEQEEQYQAESIQDLRATVSTQTTYINTLEDRLKEKEEINKSLKQQRIKISVSQMYRDVLMMRNTNAIYANILIDNNKYVKLEPI